MIIISIQSNIYFIWWVQRNPLDCKL